MCGIWTAKTPESVLRLSSVCPWSSKREKIPSSVVSALRSSSVITPFNACSKLVIRGDRFGDDGDPDLGVGSTGPNGLLSVFSVGTEEGT